MKMYRIEDYVNLENPTPGESHRPEILTTEHHAKNLGGMLGLLVPGSQVPYHDHQPLGQRFTLPGILHLSAGYSRFLRSQGIDKT